MLCHILILVAEGISAFNAALVCICKLKSSVCVWYNRLKALNIVTIIICKDARKVMPYCCMGMSCMGMNQFNTEDWNVINAAVFTILLCGRQHPDGLVQERRISFANALELHLSCTNPLMCDNAVWKYMLYCRIHCRWQRNTKTDWLVNSKGNYYTEIALNFIFLISTTHSTNAIIK